MTVAVEFVEAVETRDIVERGRPVGMARHVHLFPRRELAEKLAQDLLVLLLEGADFDRHIEGLRRRGRSQLGDAPLELDQALLAFDDQIIAHARTYSSNRTRVSFSSRRSTTISMAPFSSKNSAV